MQRRQRSLATVLGVLATAALVAFVVPTSANHPQTDSGKSIVFDHKAGNAYWVEVTVGGADAARVTKVEAQLGAPSGREWTNLPKQSWGAYAASFYLGDDADVRFRATFSDGAQAVSCWFDHPSGVENCSYGPTPGTWRSTLLGEAGSERFGGPVEMADVDHDGDDEAFVASAAGVFMFRKSATGWQRSTVFSAPDQDFETMAIGTTMHNGGTLPLEVYTAGRVYDNQHVITRLMWHHYNGTGWYSEVVFDFRYIADLVMGDIDDDGYDELLMVTDDDFSHIVYAMHRSPGDFHFTEVARTPHNTPLGLAAVGDADRDLDQELYVVYGHDYDFLTGVLRIDRHETGWVQDFLFLGDHGIDRNGFAVGDGDNDGLDEVYLMESAFFPDESTLLHRYSWRPTGWAHVAIPMGKGLHHDLVLGDGNGDGLDELYSGTLQGHLAQVQWTGTAWASRAAFQLGSGEFLANVAIGDSDGDGKTEVYGTSYDGQVSICCPTTHVHRMAVAAGSSTTTTTGSSSTTTGSGFDATFTGVRGNEWWEQASVAASGGTLSKVDVRLNGGAWQPLTKQSWGGWAASYRAVQGTTVQLRATSTAGATDVSDCYRWIPPSNTDAAKVACGSSTTTTTTPPGAFDATFSGVKGNDWWVQTSVSANQPVQEVAFRTNCSEEWRSLTKQSYGWAASFHVSPGSKVDFRATSTSGNSDISGGYVWPNATPTSAC